MSFSISNHSSNTLFPLHPTINHIPAAVISDYLTPFLGVDNDLIHINQINKFFYNASQKELVKYKEEIFLERFGIRTTHDNPSVDKVYEKIANHLAISKEIGLDINDFDSAWVQQYGYHLYRNLNWPSFSGSPEEKRREKFLNFSKFFLFDSQGKPIFVENPFAGLTFLEKIKLKYRYYRGEIREETITQIGKIYSNFITTMNECETLRNNSTHPLQVLRDCIQRVRTIEEERINLEIGFKSHLHQLDHFIKNLSVLEKIVFRVVSWFHSFFHKVKNTSLLSLERPKDLISYAVRGVILGTTEIDLNGKTPVAICANLAYGGRNNLSKLFISIQPSNVLQQLIVGDSAYASMSIRREWNQGKYRDFTDSPIDNKPTKPLNNRKLVRFLGRIGGA